MKAHFGDPATMQLKPEHGKFSGYFNVDNGTGAIRGVYLQGNEAVAPIFQAWMEPFRNMGMTTLAIRNTTGTDHLSYDAVGLPGFQFIQDEVEYNARTHHSNMDTYERIQPNDMMRNAVIVASFVLNTANRDEKLPRKPLPKPDAAGTSRGTRSGSDAVVSVSTGRTKSSPPRRKGGHGVSPVSGFLRVLMMSGLCIVSLVCSTSVVVRAQGEVEQWTWAVARNLTRERVLGLLDLPEVVGAPCGPANPRSVDFVPDARYREPTDGIS